MTPRSLRSKTSLAAGLAAAALLGGAGSASAEVICLYVPVAQNDGCELLRPETGERGKDLQSAIDYAETTAAGDTIVLGQGRYDQGAEVSTGATGTFYYNPASVAASGALTIRPVAGAKVTLADSSTAGADETVEGRETGGPLTLRDLTIEGPPNAGQSLGAELAAPGSLVERVQFISPVTATATDAYFGGVYARASATVLNSTFRGFQRPIEAGCDGPQASGVTAWTVVARYVTANGQFIAGCAAAGRTATLDIRDSVLASGARLGTTGTGALSISRSRWDGPSTFSNGDEVTPGSGLRTDGPGFVSATDWHLAANSPLIDAGVFEASTPDPYAGGDLEGKARNADGDGNGTAIPDLGAYERPFPGGTPTPTPAATATPTVSSQPTPTPTPTAGGATPTPVPVPTAQAPVPTPTPAPTFAGARLTGPATKLDGKGRVKLRVACPAGGATSCTGTVQLLRITGKGKKQKTTVLGSASFKVSPGKGADVRITVKAANRKALKKSGGKLTTRARTRDAASGSPVTTTGTLTVKRG